MMYALCVSACANTSFDDGDKMLHSDQPAFCMAIPCTIMRCRWKLDLRLNTLLHRSHLVSPR
ncbi:hypothetical protein L798_06096 [Zootermopsis nevadensis]|uniref:Uncharacterized protein n=1 Tax=Zootermopsis nevadensis TaxID=136037 RepID=A0A067RGF9_ZOONE|nr:hypothetical protein L798_06096 [Zootermopsis nevadensis]